ncbi:MAG: hypothetical protein RXO26_00415 [Caldivirga sp.]
MRFKSKLASLVAAVVLAAVIVSILLLVHVAGKQGTAAKVNFNAPESMGIILNVPVYVVGPQSLTQRLVGVGVPQSLIKLIGLNQLPSLPGNSTIIIDYSVIKPSVVAGVVNGVVRLNLTSPVITLLTGLVAKGDLIMLYGNSSDLMAMEYLLAYTWAKKYGTLYLNYLNGRGVPSDYLIAYPIIPINSKEALAVAFGGPNYLIIGPAIPRDILRAVITYMALKHPSTSQAQVGVNLDPTQDPCWLAYSNYYEGANELEPGIYEGNHNYLIWAAPLSGAPYTEWGIEGYSDGNGTFYYDTCLEVSTQVIVAAPSYVPLYVYGYVGYRLSETMANNGGEVLSETGAIDYYTSYKYYNESITNSIIEGPYSTGNVQPQPAHLTTWYGFSEGISLNYGPSTQAYGYNDGNVTWRFNFNKASNPDIDYYNDFDDSSPNWIMPYPLGLQQFYAYLPVYMSVKVLTSSRCYLIFAENTYEYVWVDGGWWLTAQPMGSSTGLVPSAASYIPSQQLPGTYVSGVASWSAPTLELCQP